MNALRRSLVRREFASGSGFPAQLGPTSSRLSPIHRHLSSDASGAQAYLNLTTKGEDAGLSYLVLDRAKAKNAISMRMLEEMRSALDTIRYDGSTRALIVHSAVSGIFCAGADLKERRGMSPTEVQRFLLTLRTTLAELSSLPIPTIAAIDGPTLGGGCELALACDLRVAGAGVSKIGLPETRLAIIPGAGGTQRLSRLVGLSRAKELIFTSRILTAQQAHDIGLVDKVAAEGQTGLEAATELAREILPAGPLAIRAAKLAIDRGESMDLEAGLDFEHAAYNSLIKSNDRLEGLAAFMERRKPVYEGN